MSQLTRINDRPAALEFLYGRIDYERTPVVPYGKREFKLERMRELLRRLGDPQDALRVVHVAGTKGKGSTAAMIAGVLTAAGHRSGLFTSPHLDRLEERLAIDSAPCSGDELVRLVDRVKPIVEAMDAMGADDDEPASGPTYFEITTAMALLHFAERQVDAAVLEVGLGGRLDSTNVCQSVVSIITDISFDHTQQLGNTLAAIAREKAGIVKPGVPVISGVTGCEPREVIREICRQRESPLIELDVHFDFDYHAPRNLQAAPQASKIDVRFSDDRHYDDLTLGLLGRHQGANASVAVATLGELRRQGWRIDDEHLRRGLREIRWPARIEVLSRRPTVVVDAAHNVASIEALLNTLDESFDVERRVLIFATTQDKDIEGMLARLLPKFSHIVFTKYRNNPRSVPPEQLAAISRTLSSGSGTVCRVCTDVPGAWDHARRLVGERDLICVAGSFFIAAEMRTHLGADD
ncbi:MAG: bifunctional folylpolyglutamate synthase/dihydrofolate synthase [Planctomycetes bacterium]|nr:bifunctional folylpolyglutamate synthase/dihydrofolate synthase [Planctomycetota bacterium]